MGSLSKEPDSELREEIVRRKTEKIRVDTFNGSLEQGRSFCYETNFNSTPMYWPDKFEAAGYKLHMMFLCLRDKEQAIERVKIRVANGGHHVRDDVVESRFKEGYKNLNIHYRRFSRIDLIDSSRYGRRPRHFLTIENGEVLKPRSIPDFLERRLPEIIKLL